MLNYTQEEIDRISSSVNTLDYFLYLEQKGKVQYHSKKGRDYFFKSDSDKFSVNEKGFFSFRNNQGGQVLKAVMSLENKSWKESLDFLAEFSHQHQSLIAERKTDLKPKKIKFIKR